MSKPSFVKMGEKTEYGKTYKVELKVEVENKQLLNFKALYYQLIKITMGFTKTISTN